MRKILIFLTPLLVLTIIFLLGVLVVNRDSGKGALQITSIPPSQVFVDGKYVGKTPLCLCELSKLLKVGDYTVKLIPVQTGFKAYEQRVTLYRGILTVVDRTFDSQIAASSGSVITLSSTDEKKAQLLVLSFPDKADVILDSNPAGKTPLLLDSITASDHEIKILKDGYKEKILKLRGVEGKKLEVTVFLGIRSDITTQPKTPEKSTGTKVVILDTPTGYLRVRAKDSVNSDQIATIYPGDKLDLISEKGEWFEIKLKDGTSGFVSSTYARKE